MRRGASTGSGNWLSAFALFAYAAGFSFAYVSLPAATGALLLFGAVQASIGCGGVRRAMCNSFRAFLNCTLHP